MLTFCTLFNVNYLDKGLTLYDSLVEVAGDFELYILAMDDKCFDVLTDLAYPQIKPIRLSDFEDEELLRVKKERTSGEYCWTCTPSLIRYVLNKFQPEYCAYIDADMYFYADPRCIIEEMERRGASVQITGHRFYDDVADKMSWRVGRYCVEYNTFKNDENGRMLLEIWRNQCLEHCSADGDGIHYADQKYMDNWVDDYPFVIETENLGAGVAPWNIAKYKMIGEKTLTGMSLTCEKKPCELLFYHYQGIVYHSQREVDIKCFTRKKTQKHLVYRLYIPYLQHIDRNKQLLKERYGIEILLKYHPGGEKPKLFKTLEQKTKALLTWIFTYSQHRYDNFPFVKNKLNVIKF